VLVVQVPGQPTAKRHTARQQQPDKQQQQQPGKQQQQPGKQQQQQQPDK
jgi:hypothetical protein